MVFISGFILGNANATEERGNIFLVLMAGFEMLNVTIFPSLSSSSWSCVSSPLFSVLDHIGSKVELSNSDIYFSRTEWVRERWIHYRIESVETNRANTRIQWHHFVINHFWGTHCYRCLNPIELLNTSWKIHKFNKCHQSVSLTTW